jgi:hypothetical protein
MAREFPYPDPLLNRLPAYRPSGFYVLSPYEQSVRGRYALIAMCAGIDRDLAWAYAMKPEALAEIERDTLHLTDDQIEAMVRDSVAPMVRRLVPQP